MSKYNATVLIVEDDVQILDFISYALKKEGFRFVGVSKVQDALKKLASETIDIIILDLGLPDIDGMEVIKAVREWSKMPIIVVSARGQDMEKVSVLDSGADDYLTKPFSSAELMARIRVAIRHIQHLSGRSLQANPSVGGLRIDYDKRLVYLEGVELHLTPMEYNSQRILTTLQLADFYGTDSKIISKNFARNKTLYKNGEHYFFLDGKLLQEFRANRQFDELPINLNRLYLWTEKGALLHAKSLGTDKAWEVYNQLVENYFYAKEEKMKELAAPQQIVKPVTQLTQSELQLIATLADSVKMVAGNMIRLDNCVTNLEDRVSQLEGDKENNVVAVESLFSASGLKYIVSS